MKEYSFDANAEIGKCFLIYGETGCGKTYSFASLPGPVLILNREPRDPRTTLMSNPKSKTKKIVIREYEGFDDTMRGLQDIREQCEEGTFEFKSLCFDSLSFEQSQFKMALEDSRFEKETEYTKSDKRFDTLVDRFRIEQGDWGSMGSMMKRLTKQLNMISKFGITVVATATMVEYPRWNKELSAAPAFQGVDFSSVFHGYFDFIGLVQKQHGDNPYPPVVHFVSDGNFTAKSCSRSLNEKGGKGPLDFEKILKIIDKDKEQ